MALSGNHTERGGPIVEERNMRASFALMTKAT